MLGDTRLTSLHLFLALSKCFWWCLGCRARTILATCPSGSLLAAVPVGASVVSLNAFARARMQLRGSCLCPKAAKSANWCPRQRCVVCEELPQFNAAPTQQFAMHYGSFQFLFHYPCITQYTIVAVRFLFHYPYRGKCRALPSRV